MFPAIFRPDGGIAWNSSKEQLGVDIETFDSIHVGFATPKIPNPRNPEPSQGAAWGGYRDFGVDPVMNHHP